MELFRYNTNRTFDFEHMSINSKDEILIASHTGLLRILNPDLTVKIEYDISHILERIKCKYIKQISYNNEDQIVMILCQHYNYNLHLTKFKIYHIDDNFNCVFLRSFINGDVYFNIHKNLIVKNDTPYYIEDIKYTLYFDLSFNVGFMRTFKREEKLDDTFKYGKNNYNYNHNTKKYEVIKDKLYCGSDMSIILNHVINYIGNVYVLGIDNLTNNTYILVYSI